MASLVLKPGREKSLLRKHPWIFSGAVDRIEGHPGSGETVDLLSSGGDFLARASYSPVSQIRARIWTFEDERVDEQFFVSRIRSALQVREALGLAACTDAYRLLYAESDGMPGLIVDRYADVLVMQCLTAGAEHWKGALADILLAQTGLSVIYERSDADVRALEGLPPCTGVLRGSIPAVETTIREYASRFRVDLSSGQKTGFYLDQRMNRKRISELANGREVLDCFCYTGGFSVGALAGGAEKVVAVDTSAEALSMAGENLALNGLAPDCIQLIEEDVFRALRRFRDEGRTFDMVILDPPKFAPTAAHAKKAARGYKDINRLAFLLLRAGGLLATFSCSGGIDAALFQKIVASAALDAGVDARILEVMAQGPDHPVSLHFPEGAYLKGLVCLVS